MHQSDADSSTPPPTSPISLDWRPWLLLLWAAIFGLLYAQMVVERRGVVVARAARSLLPGHVPPGG